jgi:hypothetical protein
MPITQILALLFLTFSLQSCLEAGSDEASAFQIREPVQINPTEPVTFAMLQSAIFDNQCMACHAWSVNEAAVRTRIVPGQPESSRVYLRVEDGSMPMGGPELTLEQLDLLRRYIMELE